MELTDYRIALHRAAETGQHLPKTKKIITSCLENLCCFLFVFHSFLSSVKRNDYLCEII